VNFGHIVGLALSAKICIRRSPASLDSLAKTRTVNIHILTGPLHVEAKAKAKEPALSLVAVLGVVVAQVVVVDQAAGVDAVVVEILA